MSTGRKSGYVRNNRRRETQGTTGEGSIVLERYPEMVFLDCHREIPLPFNGIADMLSHKSNPEALLRD